MSTKAPLRVGVVGCGRMGRHHVRVASQADGAELVAIADASEERRTTLAEQFGGTPCASLDELLAVGVQAIVVATPTVTHRDIVLATNVIQGEGYAPDKRRHVDFLTSYPVGDMALGELRGPMREETVDWLNRVSLGLKTQHATAAEGHNRLMLTKAIDLSARLRRPVPLPISAGDIRS